MNTKKLSAWAAIPFALKFSAWAAIPFALMVSLNAQAAFIETSNSCPGGTGCEPTSTDSYGSIFRIEETTTSNVYLATLTNTSDPTSGDEVPPGPLIDGFAFNMDALLNTDFSIANINPDTWSISASGQGIQFDYVGETSSPFDRLAAGEALTFEFVFDQGFLDSLSDVFALWTETEPSLGTGFGGGTDSGQVAVSFQNLSGQEGSDLLASNWPTGPFPPGPQPTPVPEPSTVLLMGLGFLGFGASRLKAKKS